MNSPEDARQVQTGMASRGGGPESNRVVREELHGRYGQTLMLLTHMRLKWLPVIRDSGWR
jgi:hypothetical protein